MSCRDLFLRVECYVSLRRALGYVVTSEEKLLKDFVRFVEAQMVTGPIRAQIALDWACMPSPGRGLAGQTSRLKVVRGFLSHLQAATPETEVPGPGMLAKVRRPKPYLYSRQQIETLMQIRPTLRYFRLNFVNHDWYLCTLQLPTSCGCMPESESVFIMTACRTRFSFLNRVPTCPTMRCGRPSSVLRVVPALGMTTTPADPAFTGYVTASQ